MQWEKATKGRSNNRAKLLAVLEELRRAAGPEVPAGILLRLAAHIVRAGTVEPDELEGFGRQGPSRLFSALPLDEAMQDGGWRILDFERRQQFSLDGLDFEEQKDLEARIERILGPEWQQQRTRQA